MSRAEETVYELGGALAVVGLVCVYALIFATLPGCGEGEEAPPRPPELDPRVNHLGPSAYFAQSENYPPERLLEATAGVLHPALPILWHSAGTSPRAVRAWSESHRGKVRLLETHLTDETCRKYKKPDGSPACYAGNLFIDRDNAAVSAGLELREEVVLSTYRVRIREIRAFCEELEAAARFDGDDGAVVCLLSTGLEDQFSREALEVLLGVISEEWPEVLTVRAPLHDEPKYGATFGERHGLSARCGEGVEIVNLDGDTAAYGTTLDWVLNNRDCLATFTYDPGSQGRGYPGVPFEELAEPRKRRIDYTAARAREENEIFRIAENRR